MSFDYPGWGRIAFFFSPLLLFAQQDLTPQDAVRLALEQNAYLAGAASRITAAEGLRTQAGLKPNPRLFLQSENARIPVSAPIRFWTDTDSFSYLSQVIESNGKRQRRVDLASQNVRGAELSLALQKAQVASRVLAAYWNAVGAERLASVLGESLKVLDQTVQFQRLRVREGALPEADLTRVLLEYQQVAITHKNALQDARRLTLLLYREMGMPQDSRMTLRGDLAAVEPVAAPDMDAAVENRADVRLSLQAVQQSQASLRLQQANARPDPEVLFGYKRTLGFNTMIAGVQINLPVRNKNQGAIAAATADSTAAAADLRANRTAAKTEIEALLGEYQQKRELVEQMLPTLREQANLTRRIADAVYREGASDLLRLLDAERVRIQTETLYVQSLINYRLSAINLQTALGQLP